MSKLKIKVDNDEEAPVVKQRKSEVTTTANISGDSEKPTDPKIEEEEKEKPSKKVKADVDSEDRVTIQMLNEDINPAPRHGNFHFGQELGISKLAKHKVYKGIPLDAALSLVDKKWAVIVSE